jgi:DNA-directed RNA polymerase specialized sigma24 family protein
MMSKRRRHALPEEPVRQPRAYWVTPADKQPALDTLRLFPAARAEIDEAERQLVIRALAAGATFAEIADALTVSRQSVHKRYGGQLHVAEPRRDGSVRYSPHTSQTGRVKRGVNDR